MGDTYEEVVQVTMRDMTVQAMQTLQQRLDSNLKMLRSVSGKSWDVRLSLMDRATAGLTRALTSMRGIVGAGLSIPLKVAGLPANALKGVLGAFSPSNLAGLGFATYGIQMLGGVAVGAANAIGFGLGTEMENTGAQINAFTKDAAKTAEILDLIKTEAAATPFSFQDMASAAAGLLPVTKTSNIGLQDLMKSAEVLSASNPMQGFEGAVFSLREALTGDFVSITDRFNLSRASINKWKAAGLSNFEVVKHAMADMGYDADLVANMGKTMTGRWSTFQDTIHDVQRALIQPIFERVSASLVTLQGLLDANMPMLKEWASNIGNAVGSVADKFGRFVGNVKTGWDGLISAFSIDEGAMGIVLDQIRAVFGDNVADFIEPGVQAFQRFIPKISDAGGWLHYAFDDLTRGDIKNALLDISIAFERMTGINLTKVWQDFTTSLQVFEPSAARVGSAIGFIVDKIDQFTKGPGEAIATQLQNVGTQSITVQPSLQGLADVVNGTSGAVDGFVGHLRDAWHWLEDNKAAQTGLVGITAALTAGVILQNVMLAIRTAILIAQAAPMVLWIAQMYAASVAMGVLNAVMAINPFVAIGLAIIGAAAGLVFLYNTSEDFRNTVDPILHWFGDAVTFMWENAVKPAMAEIQRVFEDFKTKGPAALLLLPARLMELGLEIMNGLIKGFTGVDVLGWIRTNITDKIPDFIKDALGIHSPSSVLADIGSNMMQGLLNGLGSQLPNIMSFMGNLSNVFGGMGGDVMAWISSAIKATGVPDAWASGLGLIIQHESGGNPAARNDWDVNAQMGDPSVGLGQLTGSNRARYTPAGLNPMDPIAQVIAMIKYIQDRYGDIGRVPGVASVAGGGPYVPYDSGGFLPTGTSMAVNRTGSPEPVLTSGQWDKMSRPSVVLAPAAGSVVLQIGAGVSADAAAAFRAILPAVADELWGLFGEHILEAAGNQ